MIFKMLKTLLNTQESELEPLLLKSLWGWKGA